MPDITMCHDSTCTRCLTCYRFTATPCEWRQSYFVDSPRKGDECVYYWEVDKKEV